MGPLDNRVHDYKRGPSESGGGAPSNFSELWRSGAQSGKMIQGMGPAPSEPHYRDISMNPYVLHHRLFIYYILIK